MRSPGAIASKAIPKMNDRSLTSPFLKKNKGLPLSGSDGELHYHQEYVNYGKTDGSNSHSHMPFEGDIVETLQHKKTQKGSCQETDERDNSQNECKGKTKDHDMTEGSYHNLHGICREVHIITGIY